MTRLDELCDIKMGQSPDSSTYNTNGKGLPFYQGNADFGDLYPTARVYCAKPIKIAEEGDVLISVRAPIGAVNFADRKCCIGRGLAAISPKHGVSSAKYLYYFLIANHDKLNSYGTGSTFKAITGKVLFSLAVKKVSYGQQIEIAYRLDKLMALISKRKKQIQKLNELVKSQFIEMFGNAEYNTKGLPIDTLGNLCNVGSSKRIYQNELTSDGVEFLRISDLNERIDGVQSNAGLFIAEETFSTLFENEMVPCAGDILVTARGTLGRCYIVKPDDRFYFQDGMITWLSKISKKVTSLYLIHLFNSEGIKKQISSMQAGSTVAYLSIAMTKKLGIMIPPIDQQIKFAAFVEQTDKSKVLIEKCIFLINALRKMEFLKEICYNKAHKEVV